VIFFWRRPAVVKVKKSTEISPKEVHMPGTQGVSIRRLITREDGAANFAMRLFQVQPGGHTPRHRHVHEHEVYVLGGKGSILGTQGEMPLETGSAVLVPPQQEHQFRNSGREPLVFLCIVPIGADV
jgi:quercetin dioxygenase-like cupin family protein